MGGPGKKVDPSDRKGCLVSSGACHVKDLGACLLYAAPREASVVLQNSGEVPLRVRVTLLPANVTYDEIQLARQQIEEVNVTAKVEESTSIVLNAGSGNFIVRLKQPTPGGNFHKNFPCVSQVSPIHGVYLFFATVLVIGGAWACCKFGKSERHVDAVPYQELEMSRTEADSPTAVDVEVAEGWDDDWGDEIREVKSSPSQSRVGNGSANGHMLKSSNKDGWDDNWND